MMTGELVNLDSRGVTKHSQALLYPSQLVTIGILYALKGCGERACYRWLMRDYRPLFSRLPERTRLFRTLTVHRAWHESLQTRRVEHAHAD